MSKKKKEFLILALLILSALWRVYISGKSSVFANFTPVGAMALMGGFYFRYSWKAFFYPFFTLFISDVWIMQGYNFEYSNGLLYDGWYWTYFSFIILVALTSIFKKINIGNILLASILGAFIQWLILDFGCWFSGGIDITTKLPLTRDMLGLMKCYKQGFPFMKNILLSNIIFSILIYVIYVSYQLLKNKTISFRKRSYIKISNKK